MWAVPLPPGISERGLSLLRSRVFAHFDAAFPLAQPAVPIAYQDAPYSPAGTAWVRISVRAGARLTATAGRPVEGSAATRPRKGMGSTGRRERTAVVFVQTFVPLGADANAANTAAGISDDAEAVFDGQLIDGLRVEAPDTQVVGPEGGWYVHLTRIPVTQTEYPSS